LKKKGVLPFATAKDKSPTKGGRGTFQFRRRGPNGRCAMKRGKGKSEKKPAPRDSDSIARGLKKRKGTTYCKEGEEGSWKIRGPSMLAEFGEQGGPEKSLSQKRQKRAGKRSFHEKGGRGLEREKETQRAFEKPPMGGQNSTFTKENYQEKKS